MPTEKPENLREEIEALYASFSDAVGVPLLDAAKRHAINLRDLALRLAERVERLEAKYRLLQAWHDSSPLCPDHRDKFGGKPCLACSLETATRERDEARRERDEAIRICNEANMQRAAERRNWEQP